MWFGLGAVIIIVSGVLWWQQRTTPTQSPSATISEPYSRTTIPTTSTTPEPTSSTPSISQTNMHLATITTGLGDITFETFDADAPETVKNFITLADKGFYDGVIFHRVIKNFMIQGGDPTGTGTGGPGYTFADELDPNTPSAKAGYQRGVVAMANAGPNTNGSQFFIMHADNALPHNYTIFGKVVKGMDVVDKIAAAAVVGDRPLSPVAMTKVIVTDNK